jgi:hypothetical protein
VGKAHPESEGLAPDRVVGLRTTYRGRLTLSALESDAIEGDSPVKVDLNCFC